MRFDRADELLSQGKLGDLAIIGTQDAYHFEPCKRALELGYDVLLEKPIAITLEESLALGDLAEKLGRRVVVCHVLRYTQFYQKLREIIQSGRLGRIISFNANEGVGAWHFAHSFVRGHWGNTKFSAPMMVAKCCHDMDILPWLLGSEVEALASFGELSFFRSKLKPGGVPERCVERGEDVITDPFDSRQYAGGEKFRRWLGMVYENAENASTEEIFDWLKRSPWGRKVDQCDNDQPDHQVMAMKFVNGITGTFTMTAFEEGRHLELYGTKARLRAGNFYKKEGLGDIIITDHFAEGQKSERIELEIPKLGYYGHGGGDYGLIDSLYEQITGELSSSCGSMITDSLHSHVIAFAAEHARITEEVVNLREFEAMTREQFGSQDFANLSSLNESEL